jgi:hypothetical protein
VIRRATFVTLCGKAFGFCSFYSLFDYSFTRR